MLAAALSGVVEDTTHDRPPTAPAVSRRPTQRLPVHRSRSVQNFVSANSRPLPGTNPESLPPGQGCTFAYPHDENIPSGEYVTAPHDSDEQVERVDDRESEEPEVLTRKQANFLEALNTINENEYTPTGRVKVDTVRLLQAQGRLP